MSWSEAKRLVLECLKDGRIQHEQRGDIDIKNHLATGQISVSQVEELLRRARGNDHRESKHHLDRSVVVHVVKRQNWYIKWYFLEPDSVFISVHPEELK